MDARRTLLGRIADALENIAPAGSGSTDWHAHPAYLWDGGMRAIEHLECIPLDTLRGVERQKSAICDNLTRLAKGAAAHDMLLWGARGMGKSALVRAAIVSVQAANNGAPALVQITPEALPRMADLLAQLSQIDRAFVLFLDDLGFGDHGAEQSLALRSLLDGGVISRPARIRIAVTSNRRAVVRRDEDEPGALHERDERDNALALADRFGLTLGFHPCDEATYLEIVGAYVVPLGLEFDPAEAVAFAIGRGNRSGRTAYQFATEIAGRAGRVL